MLFLKERLGGAAGAGESFFEEQGGLSLSSGGASHLAIGFNLEFPAY